MNLLLPVVLVLISLWTPLLCIAAPEDDQQMQSINIGKLRQEISSHEEKIDQSSKEEISVLDELARLDEKIKKQKVKIDELKARIRDQEQVIDSKEKELAAINKQKEALEQHLLKRLRSFYLMGKTGFLNIVFSSKNLPDLLLTNDAFHALVTYDQSVFAAYRSSLNAINRIKRSHELEKSVLENFLADADREDKILQQSAGEKNGLLKQVQAQRGLYEQALKEMKKAERKLTATLANTTRGREQKVRGFLLNKGKLPPPVWGKVISQFNQPSPKADDSPEIDDATFANGITIKTSNRSEVYAVYDGEVIFAGYMRGYGKMVVIDHDQQYYSVTARFDELQVKEGETVKQGQVIGTTGEIATLFGKGLYFEIRHDAIPENPLDWLQPRTLTLASPDH